jgi:hypothetical protein
MPVLRLSPLLLFGFSLLLPTSALSRPSTNAAGGCQVPGSFIDVPANATYAARGVICGYGDGTFGSGDQTLRAQMAALIARAMGWDAEDWGNTFPDKGVVDDALWRNVGTLAHYDVARGYPDGTYDPTGNVLYVQVVAFITRAMVTGGYWAYQPDDISIAPNVHDPFPDWDQPSTRGWFAEVLWGALTHLPRDSKLYGIDFSPVSAPGDDPTRGTLLTEDQVRSRLAAITTSTTWIRAYGCDLGGVTSFGAIAHQLGLKIAQTAWLAKDQTANEAELSCLLSAASCGEVDMAIVGSETVLRNDLSEGIVILTERLIGGPHTDGISGLSGSG